MKNYLTKTFAPLLFVLVSTTGCKKHTPDPPVTSTAKAEISSFQPSAIYSDQVGYAVSINGSNFGTDKAKVEVRFSGIIATISTISDTQIIALTPSGLLSTGKITVTINGVITTSATDFLVTPPLPTFGTLTSFGGLPGSVKRVVVNNLDNIAANNSLTLNGMPSTVNSSLIYLYFTVPANATSGKLALTSRGTTITSAVDFIVPKGSFSTIANLANYSAPVNISFDAAGNLYGTSGIDNTVLKITPTGAITTIATVGDNYAVLGGCVADPTGNVYVTSLDIEVPGGNAVTKYVGPNSYKIFKITPAGVVTALAGSGSVGYADGVGSAAQFANPTSLAIDAAGNLYVADANRIRKVTPNGTVTTIAGNNNTVLPVTDGLGTAASFNGLQGITTDASGNMYVYDGGNVIRKITSAGMVTTVSTTYNGVAQVTPYDTFGRGRVMMAIDAGGNMFIGTNSVYKIDKAGVITDTYLSPVNTVNGMVLDADGALYLSGNTSVFNSTLESSAYKIVKVVYK